MKKTIKLNANQRLAAIQRIAIIAIAAVMALAFTTCEGPMGPQGETGATGGTGPAGPQGPTGAADPATCEHYFQTSLVTVQPTETKDGFKAKKCIDCLALIEPEIYPAWNKFYGTWKKSGSYDTFIIIDKDNFKLDDDDGTGDHLYFSISSWGTAGLNTNANQSDKDAVPFYQQITGTTTSQQGYSSTTTISVGLNVNGTLSVSTFGGTSLSAGGTFGNFIKQ
jgi:hypothetical protein